MVVNAPARTLEQRLSALERANEIRVTRAAWKRDVKAGRASVRELVQDPPWWAASMKVHDALMVMPKLGRVKVGRMLARQSISPSKTIGGMTGRQRLAIVAFLLERERLVR